MSGKILVDTDILIDLSRQNQAACDFIRSVESAHTLSISVITHMELVVGCRNKKELRELKTFLTFFQLLPVSEIVSHEACNLLELYRLSHGLLIPDALIAATAIVHAIPLASKNRRDFSYIKSLTLKKYPA